MMFLNIDSNVTAGYTVYSDSVKMINSTLIAANGNNFFESNRNHNGHNIYVSPTFWGTSLSFFETDLTHSTEIKKDIQNFVNFKRKFIDIKIKIDSISKFKPKFYIEDAI